ncbi:hypothetical protein ACU4GA_29100 [Methylobacterium oryzae CBMB20]
MTSRPIRSSAWSRDNGKQISDLETRLKALEDGGANRGAAEEAARKVAALQSEVERRPRRMPRPTRPLGAAPRLAAAGRRRAGEGRHGRRSRRRPRRAAPPPRRGQAQAAEAAKAVDRRLQERGRPDRGPGQERGAARRGQHRPGGARVVVADRVAAALGSGTAYAEPLATLRKLDPGTEAQAKALRALRGRRRALGEAISPTFRPIAERIAAKRQAQRARSAAETGDFRTKLLSMADGLVQIREADAPAPEAADDPESKVQAALDRGDLSAASAAFARSRRGAGPGRGFRRQAPGPRPRPSRPRAPFDGAFKARRSAPPGARQAPGR